MSSYQRVTYDEIHPPIDPEYWVMEGPYKIENVNGEWYSNVPEDHWARDIPHIDGVYVHAEYPNEVVRIIGYWNEFAIYIFRRR